METQNHEKQNGLLGKPTLAKASGVAFSVATVLPVALTILFLIVIAVSGLASDSSLETQDWYLYACFALPQLAFACTAVWYLRYTQKPVLTALREQKCRGAYLWIAIALQIGLFSFSELNVWFLEFLARFGYENESIVLPSLDGFGFVGVLFTVALLPAVFEEIIFRGILLKGLRSAFSETVSVLFCGALFAIYHQNPAQTLYQFGCGLAYAFLAIRSNSVLPTMIAHFLNNAFILTLTKCGITAFSGVFFTVYVAISALVLVGATLWLLLVDRKKSSMEQTAVKTERKIFFLCAGVGIVVCLATWISVLLGGF